MRALTALALCLFPLGIACAVPKRVAKPHISVDAVNFNEKIVGVVRRPSLDFILSMNDTPLPDLAAVAGAPELVQVLALKKSASDGQIAAWEDFRRSSQDLEARQAQSEADFSVAKEALLSAVAARESALDVAEAAARTRAIALCEAEIAKAEGDPNLYPALLFTLAVLLQENAKLAFYEAHELSLAAGTYDQETKIGFLLAVELYQRIISSYPDLPNLADVYYRLAWCLNDPSSDVYNPDRAITLYAKLLELFPSSTHAAQANFILGEYYYDKGESGDDVLANLPRAATYYQAVASGGPDSKRYEGALYKLLWVHYRLSDYTAALSVGEQLLDWSEQRVASTGKPSDVRPDALRIMAWICHEISFNQGLNPVDEATRILLTDDGKQTWRHDAFAVFAATTWKYEVSLQAYHTLQERWPLDPLNPLYQYRILELYGYAGWQGSAYHFVPALVAFDDLVARYGEDSAWAAANREDDEAMKRARSYIEAARAKLAAWDPMVGWDAPVWDSTPSGPQ